MTHIDIQFVLLDPRATVPTYAREGDAGADLTCIEDIRIEAGERSVVRTGLAIAIPMGFVGLVHPRSGLAVKHGITIVNTPGTIDAGYRGEIMICLLNTDSRATFEMPAGSRIAQLVVQPVMHAEFRAVDSLDDSERGTDGFGSTGVATL